MRKTRPVNWARIIARSIWFLAAVVAMYHSEIGDFPIHRTALLVFGVFVVSILACRYIIGD